RRRRNRPRCPSRGPRSTGSGSSRSRGCRPSRSSSASGSGTAAATSGARRCRADLMTPRKLIILTALVVGLFAFVFFFERKLPSTTERKQKGDLVWEIPEDQVEGVKLEKGGTVIELARAGEKSWRMVKPDSYPADGFAASDVVSQLARLRRTGGDSAEAKPEDYGLKTPVVKATINWKDDKGKKLTG